jgi:hypothetical protein
MLVAALVELHFPEVASVAPQDVLLRATGIIIIHINFYEKAT